MRSKLNYTVRRIRIQALHRLKTNFQFFGQMFRPNNTLEKNLNWRIFWIFPLSGIFANIPPISTGGLKIQKTLYLTGGGFFENHPTYNNNKNKIIFTFSKLFCFHSLKKCSWIYKDKSFKNGHLFDDIILNLNVADFSRPILRIFALFAL